MISKKIDAYIPTFSDKHSTIERTMLALRPDKPLTFGVRLDMSQKSAESRGLGVEDYDYAGNQFIGSRELCPGYRKDPGDRIAVWSHDRLAIVRKGLFSGDS